METKPAPTTLRGIIKHLGPGLIITATIVGSGELIATPALASEVGFTMLWFIILGCLIKVFVQIELGRYTVTHGKTACRGRDCASHGWFGFGWSCTSARQCRWPE